MWQDFYCRFLHKTGALVLELQPFMPLSPYPTTATQFIVHGQPSVLLCQQKTPPGSSKFICTGLLKTHSTSFFNQFARHT